MNCRDLRNLTKVTIHCKIYRAAPRSPSFVPNSGNQGKNTWTSGNRSCFGQHALVMAWKFVIYWSENGSDIWFCGMSIHSWSNVRVCRHFSSCRSYLSHIYINKTKIHHCRNFALYVVLLGDQRVSSSRGTRSACFVRG